MGEQFVTSFLAAAAFGILFNVPRRTLPLCGAAGMVGWMLYFSMLHVEIDSVVSTWVAAVLVALISQLFARWFRTPVIIFSVSGIIPLVPGGLAYDAMRNVVENDYAAALQLAAKAFMISGAIAVGLMFSEVMNQITRRRRL